MLKIFGIDPGFGRMGFGVVEYDGHKFELIDTGCISTETDISHAERLQVIASDLRQLLKQQQPDKVAIEELFFGKSTTTAMRVAEARGVVLLICAELNLSVIELKPNQIKLAVTGDGNADKRQMQEMVQRLLELDQVPKPDDAADALATAICAATIRF
ncbi:MAG: crossover junction endodeoxyribonuclease RuvC [Candidatus Uhrbacteria bacterium]